MKFQPLVTLTDEVAEGLRNGSIRLQCGQWVRIPGDAPGHTSKPSRFISVQPGYLNIVHPGGPFAKGKVPMGHFQARAKKRREQCSPACKVG